MSEITHGFAGKGMKNPWKTHENPMKSPESPGWFRSFEAHPIGYLPGVKRQGDGQFERKQRKIHGVFEVLALILGFDFFSWIFNYEYRSVPEL